MTRHANFRDPGVSLVPKDHTWKKPGDPITDRKSLLAMDKTV